MTTQAPAWERLPVELRQRPQWLLAGPNEAGELKVPTTVAFGSDDYVLAPGSHSDPATWLTFEDAVGFARGFGCGLGFVVCDDDPFTVVDLDIKNQHNAPDKPQLWTTPEQIETLRYIAAELDSYTELSQSGQGVHVWCLGSIGEGVKRKGVEVYSNLRFMVCTGWTIHNPAKPIQDRQEALGVLVASMRAAQDAQRGALQENEAELPDEEVWRRARTADNAAKFIKLCEGGWQELGYPSQSEADLSLMSMFTFYSRSNEQCRRLFRHTALGAREKALKNDRYLDYTLRLIRGRQAKEDAAVAAIAQQGQALLARLHQAQPPAPQPAPGPIDSAVRAVALEYAAQLQASMPAPPMPPAPPLPPPGGIAWPPGLVGDIARFVYNAAPRPVKEVAIVAALGWMAGVCGKVWVIPGSGLNMYIILVARSGVGKEAMHGGLGALTHRLREGAPLAGQFVDFNDFASGPALAKACAGNSSFVNVAGEFGRKLQRLANNAGDGPMQSLRTVMTNLYQKSGPASIAGGITYSAKDSNVASISGVAYSMIGETTPDTLYASLTESMMEDGFLSRFTIIEYTGHRPQSNPFQNLVPPTDLVDRCQKLCHLAANGIGNHTRINLQRTQGAAAVMDAFDAECDAQINSSEDESWRQMWNRAHLKMVRIAGLLCVGDNPEAPVIDVPHCEWALDVIRRDIAIMTKRLESGDVGQGDNARERKLLSLVHEFLTQPLGPSYGVPAAMQRDAVVPRKYLQMRTSRVAAFNQHPFGAKRALDDAIQSCCDSGYLAEMPKDKAGEAYTFMGRCFRVVNLPKFS